MDNTVGSRQESIICGTLLGDGLLERNGTFVRLVIDHSAAQTAYVHWKAEWLTSFCPTITLKERADPRTHRTYSHCILRTRTSPLLEKYVALFYKGTHKRIPVMLPKMITPQMLALWMTDIDETIATQCASIRKATHSPNNE